MYFCCPEPEAPTPTPAPALAVLLVGLDFPFFKTTILRLLEERIIQNLVKDHPWVKGGSPFRLLVGSQLR